jgi:hypothetical protein
MKPLITLLTLIFTPLLSSEEAKTLLVDGNPDVFTFEGKPFDGTGHGDGVAELDFHGSVVTVIDGKEKPMEGVKFSIVPDKTFASGMNQRIIFLSNKRGEFLAKLYVGAAMTMGGKEPGRVYQTARSKLKIEKAGFETQFLWFDYDMPEVKIILKTAKG